MQKEILANNIQFSANCQRKWRTDNATKMTGKKLNMQVEKTE